MWQVTLCNSLTTFFEAVLAMLAFSWQEPISEVEVVRQQQVNTINPVRAVAVTETGKKRKQTHHRGKKNNITNKHNTSHDVTNTTEDICQSVEILQY